MRPIAAHPPIVLLVLPVLMACSEPSPSGAPASLLLISVDTLRADALGCLGGSASTPRLDDLGSQGLLVEHARSHVPLTLPSHATLFTGKLPPALGLHDNDPFALAASHATLATHLQDHGYRTVAVIGGEPLARGCGLEQGFDEYLDPPRGLLGQATFGERPAEEVTRLAISTLEASGPDHPLLLFVHYFDPHRPYLPPAPFARQPSDHADNYAGEVEYVDREVGRLLDALAQDPRRWLVALTADHGEGLGEHGESTHGYHVFDSTLRVPILLAELEQGELEPPAGLTLDRDARVRLIDLAPTLLSLLGARPLLHAQGRDLTREEPDRFSYVESLAGSLHFRWAQTTGVRFEEGLLLWTGGGMDASSSVPGRPAGEAGEWWIEQAPPAQELGALLKQARQALGRFRTAPRRQVDPGLSALTHLGYVASPTDAGRHDLLPREENALLPSPLARVQELDRFLTGIERWQEGQLNAAAAILGELAEREPGSPAFLFHAARVWMALAEHEKDPELARRAARGFAKLSELEPSHPGAAALESKALGLAGDFRAAIDIARGLLAAQPGAQSDHLLGSLLCSPTAVDGVTGNPLLDPERGVDHLLSALEQGLRDPRLVQNLVILLGRFGSPAPDWVEQARERLAPFRAGS